MPRERTQRHSLWPPNSTVSRRLEIARDVLARGNRYGLVEALHLCERHRILWPDWLTEALRQAAQQYAAQGLTDELRDGTRPETLRDRYASFMAVRVAMEENLHRPARDERIIELAKKFGVTNPNISTVEDRHKRVRRELATPEGRARYIHLAHGFSAEHLFVTPWEWVNDPNDATGYADDEVNALPLDDE